MLDTNVLADALYEDLAEYPAASHLLELAEDAQAAFCVAPQVLAEFYSMPRKAHQLERWDIRGFPLL
jgi:predicted nucleic acid-binding protein